MPRRALHKRASLLLLAAFAMALPLRSFAAPHHKHMVRDEVIALEHQWRRAELDDDIPAMDKLLSDDYLGITASGDVVTKAQELDRMKERQLVFTKLELSDFKIKLIGHIAIITSLATVEGSSDGHPIDGSFRYTRVYQHLPSGAWNITNFEVTHIRGSRAGNRESNSKDSSSGPDSLNPE